MKKIAGRSARPFIVADNAIPFLKGVLEPWADVRYLPGIDIGPDDVRQADALIVRTRTRCDRRLLEGSGVRIIATATIGFDHIDTAWCSAAGIRVATAAGCNARGVLQWVAAALAHFSRIQGWQPSQKTLGIVGVGHVGSLVQEYAAAWGFRVLCCDPPRQAREHGDFLPLEKVARQADLLTFHVPLAPDTRGMANADLFRILKSDAILLNSSRGEVVDGSALLASGLTCALDVWEHEPRIDPRLLDRAALATPHIAGYSEQGKAAATALAVRAIAQAFGFPLGTWYPPQAAPSAPHPIAWSELQTSISRAFDIAAETRLLKSDPAGFERFRDNYRFRLEYF